MRIASIPLLVCPFCGHAFRISQVYTLYSRSNIRFGVMECGCDQFPIIEGIPYLKKNPTRQIHRQAVSALEKKEFRKATALVMEEPRLVRWALAVVCLLHAKNLHRYVPYSIWLLLLTLLNPQSYRWYQYLRTRTRRVTSLLALGSLALVKPTQTLIDVACGSGHFLRTAQQLTRTQLIGCDVSWSLLFQAKVWQVDHRVLLLCADIEVGLPIKSRTADVLTINDAFMYFHDKKQIMSSLLKKIKRSGVIAITHVHAATARNVGQGHGVTPTRLRRQLANVWMVMNSDYELWMSMKQIQHICFTAEFQKIPKSNSYSFLLAPHPRPTQYALPKKVSKYLEITHADYTEDEYLAEIQS